MGVQETKIIREMFCQFLETQSDCMIHRRKCQMLLKLVTEDEGVTHRESEWCGDLCIVHSIM